MLLTAADPMAEMVSTALCAYVHTCITTDPDRPLTVACTSSDRKLTKAELILAMRRDGGQLAALLGLPSPVVSSMDEHRKFTEVFEALDCQRGSRSMITFDELHECVLDSKILLTAPDRLCIGMVIKVAIARRRYVDSQYRVRAAAAQVQIALAAGAGVLFALLLLACCYRARAQHPRKHDKST